MFIRNTVFRKKKLDLRNVLLKSVNLAVNHSSRRWLFHKTSCNNNVDVLSLVTLYITNRPRFLLVTCEVQRLGIFCLIYDFK